MPTLPNLDITWTPAGPDAREMLGLFTQASNSLTGITHLMIQQATQSEIYALSNCNDLLRAEFPNLATLGTSNYVSVITCAALKTLSFPKVTDPALPGTFILMFCPQLKTFFAPLLSNETFLDITVCANLTNKMVATWSPTNGDIIDLSLLSLDATAVNWVLSKAVANAGYVSGTIDLHGGTNSPPTGAGITDKATLTGRGVTVTTN